MKLQQVSLKKDKKGVLGLDTVKLVFISFLVLAVIGIAIILTMTSLRDVTDSIDTTTVDIVNNNTIAKVNETGTPIPGTVGRRNCVLTVTSIINTSSTAIPSTNYTVTGCSVAYSTPSGNVNNSVWNVTGSYVYSGDNTNNMLKNISSGTQDFFSNTSTIYAILVVVVIILAIAIIISVVSAFGGGGGSTGAGSIGKGGKARGGGTVSGI